MLRRALLLALLGVLVMLAFIWVEPGPISIDEVTYRRMTHDLLEGHGFFLWNGYAELPSLELTTQFVRPTSTGELAAQYPYGAPLLAAPWFALLGARGMFVANVIAFVLSIWLCHRISMQLLHDRVVALLAATLLLVTFATEYALAIWPHASSVACALGAFSLAISAQQAEIDRRGVVLACATGFVAGLGITLRFDVLFVLPALVAPFFFASPTRVRPLIGIVVGALPALVLLMVTNHIRWGTWSPLSYGPKGAAHPGRFVAFAIAGALLISLLWVASRPHAASWLRARRNLIVIAGLFITLIVVFLVPAARSVVRGVLALAIDLRLRPDGTEPILYYSGFKLALVQSCPFILLALWPLVRASEQRKHLAWLAVVPAVLLAFFGARAWHGGLGLNMRYMLPGLPFLCILAAVALRQFAAIQRWWPCVCAAVVAATLYLVLLPDGFGAREQFVLTVPLVLAVLASATGAVSHRRGWAASFSVCAGLAIGWTAASTLHCASWSRDVRSWNYRVSELVAPHISPGSLLFGDIPDPYYGVAERVLGVRIAQFTEDIDDAGRLIQHELARGREIFAVLAPRTWETLQRISALKDTRTEPIGRIGPYLFGQIQAP